jgi:hypothetical protein
MKRFISSVLCAAVFFIGLGSLIEKVGAKYNSDERALNLIKLAQQAIGGEASVRAIQSLSITGKATKNFDFNGEQKTQQGDWELNMQLPNKLSKMMKMRVEDNGSGEKTENVDKKVIIIHNGDGEKTVLNPGEELPKDNVVFIRKADGDKTIVTGGAKTIITKDDEANGNVKKIIVKDDLHASFDKMQQNELFRTTLSLLLTAPQGIDAEYTLADDASVDGASCDVINVKYGEAAVKLFLDKSTHLPKMMSYMEHKPMIFVRINTNDANADANGTKTFNTKVEEPQMVEFQVKFSDYRSVGGVQMPYHWTQTVGGNLDETIDVTNYEVNSPNIADKFNEQMPQKIMIRTEKKQQ